MTSKLETAAAEQEGFPVSEIARRVGRAPQTVEAKLQEAGLLPDLDFICGSRRHPLYLGSRMDEILNLFTPTAEIL